MVGRGNTDNSASSDATDTKALSGLADLALENIGDLVWLCDPRGCILLCNPAFASFMQADRADIVGAATDRIIPESLAPQMSAMSERCLASSGPIRHEATIKSPGAGTPHLFEIVTSPVTRGTDLVGVLNVARDITLLRQMENRAAVAALGWKTLAQGSLDGVAVSQEGRFVDANDQLLRMLGVRREDLIGHPIEAFIHPDERSEVLANIGDGVESRLVHRMMRSDGKIILVEVHGQTIEVGGSRWRLTVIRDVTTLKRSLGAVRLSEARLRRAEVIAKTGIWEYDRASQTMIASEGALKIFGSSKLLSGMDSIMDCVLPAYRADFAATFRSLVEEGEPCQIDYKIHTVDKGEIKHLRSVAMLDRETGVVFGVTRDITDEQALTESLRVSEALYRSLVDLQTEYIARTDLGGRYTYVNKALADALGRKQEELIGVAVGEFTHPDDAAEVRQAMESLAGGRSEVAAGERRLRTTEGYRLIAWRACGVRDEAGRLIQIQLVGREVLT
jgi:PAS domain S-box-containing protein